MNISALNIIGVFMRKGKRFKQKIKNNKLRIINIICLIIS